MCSMRINLYPAILFFASLIIVLTCNISFAQQHPQYSLFNQNMVVYNPAYTGISNNLIVALHGRAQWYNIKGLPISQNIQAHTPVYFLHGGLGVSILNNQQGLQRNTHAGLNYSYIIHGRKYKISFGFHAGIIETSLDGKKIITPTGNYEGNNIDHNVNILSVSILENLQFDLSAGIAFESKRISFGISSVNINEPKLGLTQSTNGLILKRNYISNFSYNINFSKNVLFKNYFLAKYDVNDLQAESNISFQYKKLGFLGVGFRGFEKNNIDATYAYLGIYLTQSWILSYAYDYILSDLNNASSGSHEILLQYSLPLSQTAKPGKIIYTPRF